MARPHKEQIAPTAAVTHPPLATATKNYNHHAHTTHKHTRPRHSRTGHSGIPADARQARHRLPRGIAQGRQHSEQTAGQCRRDTRRAGARHSFGPRGREDALPAHPAEADCIFIRQLHIRQRRPRLGGILRNQGRAKRLPEAYYYAGKTYMSLNASLMAMEYFFKTLDAAAESDLNLRGRTYSQLGYIYSTVNGWTAKPSGCSRRRIGAAARQTTRYQ